MLPFITRICIQLLKFTKPETIHYEIIKINIKFLAVHTIKFHRPGKSGLFFFTSVEHSNQLRAPAALPGEKKCFPLISGLADT
jgi:hypothetical protein